MKSIKTIAFITLLIACILFVTPSQAQFGKELKERLKENLKNKTLEKSDEAVEVGIDEASKALINNIFKKRNKKYKSQDNGDTEEEFIEGSEDMEIAEETSMSNEELQEQIKNMLGGNAGQVETEEVYSFSKRIVYKMTSSVNDKPTDIDYTVWLNPEAEYMATQMDNITQNGQSHLMAMGMTNIMDYRHNVMIMIMEKQKIAQIMPMEKITGELTAGEEDTNPATVTKTGRTKTILSYECEEYQISSDDMEGSVWIAPDIEGYNQSILQSFGNSPFSGSPDLSELKGMMMEMEATVYAGDNKEETPMMMKVISIDEQFREFLLADYRSFSSNFGGNQK